MDNNYQQPQYYMASEQAPNQMGSGLQIPYDERPFEATLLKGQKIALYGNIEMQNDTDEPIYVTVRFDLRRGFILKVEGMNTPISIETGVMMHSSHALKVAGETFQIVSRNNPTESTPS